MLLFTIFHTGQREGGSRREIKQKHLPSLLLILYTIITDGKKDDDDDNGTLNIYNYR